MKSMVVGTLALLFLTPTAEAARPPAPPKLLLTAETVNDVKLAQPVGPKAMGAAVLRAQILLDRAHFSPGEIDAAYGDNVRKAILAFQKSNGITATGNVDEPTWAALNRGATPALISYKLTDKDVAGPFESIPSDMMEKSKLSHLGYSTALEGLGEKFHVSPKLLQKLNPGQEFSQPGQDIVVPNVEEHTPLAKAAKIIVSKSDSTLTLVDAAGKVLGQFPASTGSEHDPLPLGEWKVQGIAKNPVFHYNPGLFWDANPAHAKAKIPPGPNNPVGVIWIDLSKEHYGIHGTPEPSKIGKTQSHGCIRLTNWDVTTVSQAVAAGTPVLLQE
jgi:lipoprotein-anchoring transpeptidase ErfK/SrfK